MRDLLQYEMPTGRSLTDLDDWRSKAQKNEAPSDGVVLRRSGTILDVKAVDGEPNALRLVISDNGTDRQRDTIDTQGWELTDYKRNPVVLWAHDYGTDMWGGASPNIPVVGRAPRTFIEGPQLISIPEFTPKDIHPFGWTVGELLRNGFLNAASVGFQPLEWVYNEIRQGVDFLKQLLLEYSIVPIPANPRALVEARSMGIDLGPLRDWAVKMLDLGVDDGLVVVPRKTLEDAMAVMQARKIFSFAEPVGALSPGDFRKALSADEFHQRLKHELGQEPCGTDGTCKITEEAPADAGAAPAADAPTADAPTAEAGAASADAGTAEGATAQAALAYADAHPKGCAIVGRATAWVRPELPTDVNVLRGLSAWADPKSAGGAAGFKLLHHRAVDGAVIFGALAAAAADMPRLGLSDGDATVVREHLGQHYREYDEVAPWERNPEGWKAYELMAQQLARRGGTTPAAVEAALSLCGLDLEAEAVKGMAEPKAAPASAAQLLMLETAAAEVRSEEIDISEDVLRSIIREETNREFAAASGRLD